MDDKEFFNFNTAGEQRSVIPANTTCTLQTIIRPGGVGDGGWLKRSADGKSEGLNCEFVVVDGQYANRKLWALLTLRGTTRGHEQAGEISRNTLRAIVESARGIRSNDNSEVAQAKRKLSGWQDLDGLRFVAVLGVVPPKDGYEAKNTILRIITPEHQAWRQPEQLDRDSFNKANSGTAPTATPQGPAMSRPKWAE
jgi:hypothetical protein